MYILLNQMAEVIEGRYKKEFKFCIILRFSSCHETLIQLFFLSSSYILCMIIHTQRRKYRCE